MGAMRHVDRPLVRDYLRWLADQPDGVRHREWLFQAAALIDRDMTIAWIDRRPDDRANTEEKEVHTEAQ